MEEIPIEYFKADLEFQWDHEASTTNWIVQIIKNEQLQLSNLNIIWCTDDYLLKMNQDHLGHDYYTDIITFHYAEDTIDGELYISIDRIRENASALKIPIENEILRVVIHGVLHLCGYGDKSEDEILLMRKKEEESLALYNSL